MSAFLVCFCTGIRLSRTPRGSPDHSATLKILPQKAIPVYTRELPGHQSLSLPSTVHEPASACNTARSASPDLSNREMSVKFLHAVGPDV